MKIAEIHSNTTCAFCHSRDIAKTIEDVGICKYHMSVISRKNNAGPPPPFKPGRYKQYGQYKGNSQVATLDDIGRLLIPKKLYCQLGLKKGDRFTALLHLTCKFANLIAKEDGNMRIDDHNRIMLPSNMLDSLEWNASDEIAITLDTKQKLIRLALQNKYVPECVFCGSDDIVCTVQGRDICKFHLSTCQSL